MTTPQPMRLDRRAALKWMLTAAAAIAVFERKTSGSVAAGAKAVPGYGPDPDLLQDYKPGDLWPLTFTEAQRKTTAALCDVIIPADAKSPSASALGVPDFIDEWISAPYPNHDQDRKTILDGLAWLDAETQRRFTRNFLDLTPEQTKSLCDDICHVPMAKPAFISAARFFKKFRDLTAGGFYTTSAGMIDIGYVGNVPLATFDGPPTAVLQKLGLVGG